MDEELKNWLRVSRPMTDEMINHCIDLVFLVGLVGDFYCCCYHYWGGVGG